MKYKIAIYSLLIFITSSILALSQTIGDYDGRLNPKTSFEPTKISVEEARYIGIDYITESDSALMTYAGRILRRDLDFSPYFEIVLFDKFFLK
ncbi:MAG: hypothetical protein GY865_05955, partial [candidate division Zixibacteria bacterium]|nr:hypothetical protein [candidate division Zixibacteria bacterium]